MFKQTHLRVIKNYIAASFLTLVLAIALSLGISTSVQASSGLDVYFLDVGQADATVISCDGEYMMIDGGNAEDSSYIYSFLKSMGISHLKYMVATHPDEDHIGGLSGAVNYAKVDTAFSPVTTYDSKPFRSLLKHLARQNRSITVPTAGDTYTLGEASFTILGPIDAAEETNNNSIVIRLTYGNNSFLFTGDAESEEEQSILASGQKLQSDVLKVGHHGSNSSTGYQWLRTIAPAYAIISVGTDNEYGHPTEETLSKLRDAGVKTYRTDMQGTIVCHSDGKELTFTVSKNPYADTLSTAETGNVYSITEASGSGSNQSRQTNETTRNTQESGVTSDSTATTETYILNTNTKKFHRPGCSSVSKMKAKNKKEVTESRDQIISEGYSPCKNCKP